MNGRERIQCHNEAAVRIARKLGDHPFNVSVILHGSREDPHRKGRCAGFDRIQKERPVARSGLGIKDHGNSLDVRRNVLENLQPFSAHRKLEIREAGYVAARVRQIPDITVSHGVGDGNENDRYGTGSGQLSSKQSRLFAQRTLAETTPVSLVICPEWVKSLKSR